MAAYEIRNVRKDYRSNLTHVGVKGSWELTVDETIRRIEGGVSSFYVSWPVRADVIVKWGQYRKYLATTADSTNKNNLDSLPPL